MPAATIAALKSPDTAMPATFLAPISRARPSTVAYRFGADDLGNTAAGSTPPRGRTSHAIRKQNPAPRRGTGEGHHVTISSTPMTMNATMTPWTSVAITKSATFDGVSLGVGRTLMEPAASSSRLRPNRSSNRRYSSENAPVGSSVDDERDPRRAIARRYPSEEAGRESFRTFLAASPATAHHVRMRTTLRAAAACLLLAACTAAPASTPSTAPPASAPVISPVAGAGELRLPALVADLGARTGSWEEVLVVPFGPAPRTLGSEPGDASGPRGPTSFAVVGGAAPSVWVTDPVKQRLVRYSLADGSVLDAVHLPGHVPLGDLVATGGADAEVWAVLDGPRGLLAPVSSEGLGPAITIRDGGVRYEVDALLADRGRVVAQVRGQGDAGFGRLRTADGRVARWEPGARAGGAVSVDLDTSGDDLEVHWFHYQHQLATAAAAIELRSGEGEPMPSVAGVRLQGTAPDGAIAWVRVSSAKSGKGGDWILAVPPDPSAPLLFERLPRGDVVADQVRTLAVGPDGRLWLMVTDADGIHLFRR
jgi:hypothetical protein